MKYFVTSDIHAFSKPFFQAIAFSGFDKNDSNHTLIICGDLIDRGSNILEIYNYLKTIPKERLILIKGEHEWLYKQLLNKDHPDNPDYTSGTVRTFCSIARIDPESLTRSYWYSRILPKKEYADYETYIRTIWKEIKDRVLNSEIHAWLMSDAWRNYYEVDKYIFVHSFIPLKLKAEHMEDYWIDYTEHFEYGPEWREEAVQWDWDAAAWKSPIKLYNAGFFDHEKSLGRVLVCGHWSARDFHEVYNGDFSNNNNIYYSENLIALDACTILSKHVNMLIIDGDKCFDAYGNELKIV